MASSLEQLKKTGTLVVADSGEINKASIRTIREGARV